MRKNKKGIKKIRDNKRIEKYLDYINEYCKAQNAATGSKFDSNANVSNKNVATLNGEIFKGESIAINRLRMVNKLEELYGIKEAELYLWLLENHYIYRHDETNPLLPYCVSVSMYPFLFNGLSDIGGISEAPKNLQSFCGSFINFIFILSSQFAGAVATPEWLTYFDYFARKEFGEDYINELEEVVFISETKTKTISDTLGGYFQQVVYSLNQPASARNFQSVFWNISYFDREYFKSIFENFVFPDGTEPNVESVMKLQLFFMKWFRDERKKNINVELTFPVENGCAIDDGEGDYIDKETMDQWAEIWATGHEFFLYHSSTADSLSACCRLNSGFSDNTFSTSMGVGGIATGSKGVITINFNRCIQDFVQKRGLYKVIKGDLKKMNYQDCWMNEDNFERFAIPVTILTNHIHNFLSAWNELLKEELKANMLPIYSEGYISLEKQFLTIGINGFLESAEYLGIDVTTGDYSEYAGILLSAIKESNKEAKTDELMFNTEFVPAENLGVKHAKWDKKDGYFVPREIYNSYFYPVESDDLTIYDKMALQGGKFAQSLDGGSAYHCNLKEPLTAKQYRTQMNNAVKLSCPQFVNNVPNTICPNCKKKYKRMMHRCPNCGNEKLEWETRIIGYLKRVSNWSEPRQKEHERRKYK